MPTSKTVKRALTTAIWDIDDTLIPWEHPHAKAYPAMSAALSKASGIGLDKIIQEIREVNTKHGTIEYTALIQEMPSFSQFSEEKKQEFIKIAIQSRQKAVEGLIHPFPGVRLLLETFKASNLNNIAISDAPKNLAYLRLKKADLLAPFDEVIGLQSPDDTNFAPEFRMEDKPFEIPVRVSDHKKPETNLEKVLGKSAAEIRKSHFLIGNSPHSDMGLAKRYGLLFYLADWNNGTPEDHQLLQDYAPESLLKHDVATASDQALKPHADYLCVEVDTPLQIIMDLQMRGLLS